jgi:hypothetical protein
MSHGKEPVFATRLKLGARWRERRYVSQAAQIAAGKAKRARNEQSTAAKSTAVHGGPRRSMAAQDPMPTATHGARTLARSCLFVAPTRPCALLARVGGEASAAVLWLPVLCGRCCCLGGRCGGDACWTGEAAGCTLHAARCIPASVPRFGLAASRRWQCGHGGPGGGEEGGSWATMSPAARGVGPVAVARWQSLGEATATATCVGK